MAGWELAPLTRLLINPRSGVLPLRAAAGPIAGGPSESLGDEHET